MFCSLLLSSIFKLSADSPICSSVAVLSAFSAILSIYTSIKPLLASRPKQYCCSVTRQLIIHEAVKENVLPSDTTCVKFGLSFKNYSVYSSVAEIPDIMGSKVGFNIEADTFSCTHTHTHTGIHMYRYLYLCILIKPPLVEK